MWATSSRCGRRRPQAEVGTQTEDQPTPPVSPARAPAAPPAHHLTQTEEEPASDGPTHAQREASWADACATATRWVDYRRRERLEARWHEQAAERGVVAHTTAPTAHRSAQQAVLLEARAVLLADQLRRRASGLAAEGEAQTTASAAHRSAQRAVQEEATRREELGRQIALEGLLPRREASASPRRSRSRSEARRDQGILRDGGVA